MNRAKHAELAERVEQPRVDDRANRLGEVLFGNRHLPRLVRALLRAQMAAPGTISA